MCNYQFSFQDFPSVLDVDSMLGLYNLSALEVVGRAFFRVRCDGVDGCSALGYKFGLGNFIDI